MNTANPLAEQRFELAQQILQSLLQQLIIQLAPQQRAAPGLLSVVRRYLKDEGFIGGPTAAADQARLQAMWEMYRQQLERALEADSPPAAVFSEARLFLEGQGVSKDLGSATEQAEALQALGSASLPFTGH